jgi:Tau95 Triple barrel domain
MEPDEEGHAPFLKLKDVQITSLEHPCIIQNVDRGIASLGGSSTLDEVPSRPWL